METPDINPSKSYWEIINELRSKNESNPQPVPTQTETEFLNTRTEETRIDYAMKEAQSQIEARKDILTH